MNHKVGFSDNLIPIVRDHKEKMTLDCFFVVFVIDTFFSSYVESQCDEVKFRCRNQEISDIKNKCG